jgi:hypothetical protein
LISLAIVWTVETPGASSRLTGDSRQFVEGARLAHVAFRPLDARLGQSERERMQCSSENEDGSRFGQSVQWQGSVSAMMLNKSEQLTMYIHVFDCL